MAIILLKSIVEYVNSYAPAILIVNAIVMILVIYKIWDYFKSCGEEAVERLKNGQPPKEGTTTITITIIEPIKKRPINDKIIVLDPENRVNKKAPFP